VGHRRFGGVTFGLGGALSARGLVGRRNLGHLDLGRRGDFGTDLGGTKMGLTVAYSSVFCLSGAVRRL
jgi:hypothetical protein